MQSVFGGGEVTIVSTKQLSSTCKVTIRKWDSGKDRRLQVADLDDAPSSGGIPLTPRSGHGERTVHSHHFGGRPSLARTGGEKSGSDPSSVAAR
jgi:hypothetical protein